MSKEKEQKEQIEKMREIEAAMKKLGLELAKISNQICSDHLDMAISDMLETLGCAPNSPSPKRVTLEDAINWQEQLVQWNLFGEVN